MDAGGVDAPVPQELLNSVDIFSPNESELSRLTGMPTETFEQISQAVVKCYEMVSFGDEEKVLSYVDLFFTIVRLVAFRDLSYGHSEDSIYLAL